MSPFLDWPSSGLFPTQLISEFIWGFRPTASAQFRPVPKNLHTSAHTRMKPAIQPCESGRPQTAFFTTWCTTTESNSGWIVGGKLWAVWPEASTLSDALPYLLGPVLGLLL